MTGLVIAGAVAGAATLGYLWVRSRGSSADPELSVIPGDPIGTPPSPGGFDPPALVPAPGLGEKKKGPTSYPMPGRLYQSSRGDVGSRIAGRAYNLPNDGSGARWRAWQMIKSHPRNNVLSPSGVAPWGGQLVAKHDGHAPRGSGYEFPAIWIPEA